MTTAKQLPSRASRGSRIHKLIGEEAEADDAFWNQDAWNEEGVDSDYATEAEEEDVVDSDFDEEEDPDEDIHDNDDDEGGAKRKRGRPTREEQAKRRPYQEPQQAAPKRPRRVAATSIGSLVSSATDPTSAYGAARAAEKAAATPATIVPYEAPKLRQSTAQKSSASSDLRRKILEEAARLAATAKRPQVVKTRLTQEQLLVEAVRTEVENTQSLNRLERLEEEKKAENVITPKAPFTGVIVRYHSRIGMPKTITFLNTGSFPSIFDQKQPRKRERLAPTEERVDDEEDEEEEEAEEEEEEEEEEEDGEEGHDTVEEDDETRNNTAEEDTESK